MLASRALLIAIIYTYIACIVINRSIISRMSTVVLSTGRQASISSRMSRRPAGAAADPLEARLASSIMEASLAAYSCLKQATMASLLMNSSMISFSRALHERVVASPSEYFQGRAVWPAVSRGSADLCSHCRQ